MIKCFQYETEIKSAGFFGSKTNSAPTSITKDVKITALNYGPYDNGHIILGFNTGFVLILHSLDLSAMFRISVFDPIPKPISGNKSKTNSVISASSNQTENNVAQYQQQEVSNIIFDPTQMILVSSNSNTASKLTAINEMCPVEHFNLCGITLIENQASYKYIDMGHEQYMTLVIPEDKNQ